MSYIFSWRGNEFTDGIQNAPFKMKYMFNLVRDIMGVNSFEYRWLTAVGAEFRGNISATVFAMNHYRCFIGVRVFNIDCL